MDERLQKQWKITSDLLAAAANEIITADGYSQYLEFIDHNEFELALEVLEAIGDQTSVSWDFWWNLKKAAEVMGLEAHYAPLRDKLRASRSAT